MHGISTVRMEKTKMADKDPDDWSADIEWTAEDNSKECASDAIKQDEEA